MPRQSTRRINLRVVAGALALAASGSIDLGTHATYFGCASAGSIAWWVEPRTPDPGSSSTDARVVCIGTSSSQHLSIAIGDGTAHGDLGPWEIVGQDHGGAPIQHVSTTYPDANRWALAVLAWDSSGIELMIDGTSVVSAAGNYAQPWGANPQILIAQLLGGGAFQGGTYSEGRLYNVRMTMSQAAALYWDDVDPATPVARWGFDDLSGSTLSLTSGSGNAGTVTNGTWVPDVPVAQRGYKRNLLLQSEDISNAAWTKTNLSGPGGTTPGPIGNLQLYADTVTNAAHQFVQTFDFPGLGTAMARSIGVSCVVKLAATSPIRFVWLSADGGTSKTFFDLTPGTGSTPGIVSMGGNNYWIDDLGGSEYRLSVAKDYGGTAQFAFGLSNNGSSSSYAGSGQQLYVGDMLAAVGRDIPQVRERVARYVTTTTKPVWYGDETSVQSPPQNLLKNSEDFSVGGWTKGNTAVTVDQIANPVDGLVTADLVLETSATGNHNIAQSFTGGGFFLGAHYCSSIYVKDGGRRYLSFASDLYGFSNDVAFDTSTGAFTKSSGFTTLNGVCGAIDMTTAGYPGWWRIYIAGPCSAVSTNYFLGFKTSLAVGPFQSYAGDVTKGFYLFGSQINAGDSPSAYLPTTTTIAGVAGVAPRSPVSGRVAVS